jgi:DNA-binding response OmpR family regulator
MIDDEENLLFGLSAVLRRAGFVVLTATDGIKGLLVAQTGHPDLIISDVMMPPPNGFEMRKLLSQDPQTSSIPFIFLTARAAQGDKNFGLSIGADDYITKPFDSQELVARISAVLRRTGEKQRPGAA